ncbi:MAG TPA: rod-binding protein [Armatimonadota bacterium]|jgi:flagellar protein FlgJ
MLRTDQVMGLARPGAGPAGKTPGAPKGSGEVPSELRKAARDFEALLAQEILKGMRSTVPGGGLVGSGSSAALYQAMEDESLASVMADRGALGLGDLLVRQLGGAACRQSATTSEAGAKKDGEGAALREMPEVPTHSFGKSPLSSVSDGTKFYSEAIPPAQWAKKES